MGQPRLVEKEVESGPQLCYEPYLGSDTSDLEVCFRCSLGQERRKAWRRKRGYESGSSVRSVEMKL